MMHIHTVRILSNSRLGFRGAILLILGVGDALFGWSLAEPSSEMKRTAAFVWREGVMPSAAWGMIWIVVGIVLVVHAFAQRDDVGYVLAITIKILWAVIALGSWVIGDVPNGWVSAVVWGLILTPMIAVISGWPEPIRMDQVTVIDEEIDRPRGE